MLTRLTPFSIRYGCNIVLVKQLRVFLTITGSSFLGLRKSISLNEGLSLANASSLSVCKKKTTGRWAARYASTRALTFFSKAGLLRLAHRGPTLNESCASITSKADCAIGTWLGSSMVLSIVSHRIYSLLQIRFSLRMRSLCNEVQEWEF